MNIVTNWFSNNDRPKDTIGRILASAPPGTIEITQTKKPRSLLTPWITREKELKIIFRPEDSTSTSSSLPPGPVASTKSLPATKSLPPAKSAKSSTSSKSKSSKPKRIAAKKDRPARPAITSAPPSYDTAMATKQSGSEGPGVVQASVMSGVGMAALYCAKMAWEIYSSSAGEAKEEEEEEEEEEEREKRRKLGWLGG